ncbi:MAG: c-type cytochrome [Salinisphaeraceae bacterium]|nr:c-type cytochrome [Salinisphaeraceae bacterium]
MIKGLLGALLLISASLAYAEQSITEIVETCSGCHGNTGASDVPMVPSIAGLPELYLQSALTEFQDGKRPCPKMQFSVGNTYGKVTDMCRIAAELSLAEVDALAKWYSSQTFRPARQAFNTELAAKGRELHYKYCEGCHSRGGKQPDIDAGVLAGQWMPYLQAVMQDFRSGGRPMVDDMARNFNQLQDEDIQALVHFYASQQ